MTKHNTGDIQAAVDRVLDLAEEVEASADATVGGAGLERSRAILHQWIDGVKAVVANPALGRVTLIHENGRQATITSPDLPFLLSVPLGETRKG